WIAHWQEVASQVKGRINRPRQIYVGHAIRDYVKMRYREGEIPSDYETDEHKSFGAADADAMKA
ncbi:MAG: hypothetical protein IJI37_06620, partial [Opitutales bacterium]|nr:hypothetical protein [Opitutales bacterium]